MQNVECRNCGGKRKLQSQSDVIDVEPSAFHPLLQVIFVAGLFAGDLGLVFVQIITDRDYGEEQRDQDHQGEE
jgi:hypothetical protein